MSFRLTELGDDISIFQQAMLAAFVTTGPNSKIFPQENFAWKNLAWCRDLTLKNAENLRDFFLTLDKGIRVDQDDATNANICLGVHAIIDALCSKIEKLNSRFKGRLVPMGSSHNGTKIGKPDEFDYTYEMDIGSLLMGRGRFKGLRSEKGRVVVSLHVDNHHENLNLFDFPDDLGLETVLSVNGSKDYRRYKQLVSRDGEEYVLNTEHVAYAFYSLLQKSVSELDLPQGWSHGGVNRPFFSGVRFNLPAILIQIDYLGSEYEKPVRLSVDFAPVLRIPVVPNYNKDIANEYWIENEYVTCSWFRLEASVSKMAFYSYAEEIWLSEYPAYSISKSLMRICKGMCHLAKVNSPKFLYRYLAHRVASKLKDIREGKAEKQSLTREFAEPSMGLSSGPTPLNDTDAATFEDFGEVGGTEFLSSYMFKRAVMTLMILDKDKGKTWTVDDLPDLVLSVFMIINDILMSENQAFKIPTNEERSENTLAFETGARFDVMSAAGLYGQMEPPILLRQFCVPLDKYEHHQNKTREPGESSSLSAEHGQRKKESSVRDGLSSTKGASYVREWSTTTPPLYFSILKSAIQQRKCNHLVSLLARGKFVHEAVSAGVDLRIAPLFQLLRCIAQGEKSAEISIWRRPEKDASEYPKDLWLTKNELKELLDDV